MLKLCTDIRKIITESEEFDNERRVSLLNRISAVEAGTHKEKALYDVILGMVSDFGETAGKFGGDIKPLTDRVRELASIARRNTKDYDKLAEPEETKRLPSPGNADE